MIFQFMFELRLETFSELIESLISGMGTHGLGAPLDHSFKSSGLYLEPG
jgi:hypothetical protein